VVREIVNEVLASLSGEFAGLYSHAGRPSIPPEKLLRALLLQAFYSIRSERQLMEQLDFNLLFRWFVGLAVDDTVWDATVFCKNRDRLLEAEVSAKLLAGVVAHRKVRALISRDHFSVDGTLIEAWASMKSFRPKDGAKDSGGEEGSGRNRERDFRGQKRSNETHESTSDPDARLYRKGRGKEAKLCFMGHVLMENRNGLAVDGELTRAHGAAEPLAALDLVVRHAAGRRVTVGADKAFDVADFVMELRELNATPHVAQNAYETDKARRTSAVDGRTTRHPGYGASQRVRKRIEEVFGWVKESAGLRKTKLRGLERVRSQFTLALAAYNLIRLPKLIGVSP
jgi:transposase